jgi:peptide chain release factor 1
MEERYEELNKLLSDPEVIGEQEKFLKYSKEHAELQEIIDNYRSYLKLKKELEDTREILESSLEEELQEMAEEEEKKLTKALEEKEEELKLMLLPKDSKDDRNAILEIRAGTGGEEAAIFAADLLRMYTRYAEKQNWKVEVLDVSPTEMGGYKEIVLLIEGKGAYGLLKYESGVHRVQRVPVTESSGRIHTSAATVAVLPEAKEVDVEINPDDLRIDVFCSSGHGGQSVNTTQSAVRITHLPTGIVVSCQDEKSQLKNKEKALKVLRSRLLQMMEEKQEKEVASTRRTLIGSGDRSERIRTYNFPQGRVTDHRIGLTLYRLEAILEGELEELITALLTAEKSEKLKQVV